MNADHEKTTPSGDGLRRAPTMKIFGVGGAGGNAVEHLARTGFPDIHFTVINTDLQALDQCRTEHKHQLGARLTRGLGTGGDPDLGRQAAEQDTDALRELCRDTDIVFIVAGLGGGTGTGAAPILARVAKESGALVLAFAILPFAIESQRRQRQAQRGLSLLKETADGVICLANERVAKLVDEKTGLGETFRLSHEWLGQGLRGLWRLLTRPGLINVDFAHLCAVMRNRHGESAFTTTEASGPNRARDIVDRLTASPMLEEGKFLDEAGALLVSLAGGTDLSMAEVNRIMEPINRRCGNADIVLSAIVDPSLGDRLELTVIASRRAAGRQEEDQRTDRLLEDALLPSNSSEDLGTQIKASPPPPPPPPRYLPPPPPLSDEQKARRYRAVRGGIAKVLPRLQQGQLPLEVIPKGRFEKSQPTIHDGVDLDLPTFKRRGIVLN